MRRGIDDEEKSCYNKDNKLEKEAFCHAAYI